MDSLGLQTINLQLIFDGSCVCVCVCFLRQGTLRKHCESRGWEQTLEDKGQEEKGGRANFF